MQKVFIALIFVLLNLSLSAQEVTPVVTLGTFHFDFPNLDRVQVSDDNKIDVFDSKYQNEIDHLILSLAKFKPTIIVIERSPKSQSRIDSLYQQYLKGNYNLSRSEDEQIGFRLAKHMGIKLLYCVDVWGKPYDSITKLLANDDSEAYINFEKSFSEHPDSTKRFELQENFRRDGIIANIKNLNSRDNIQKSLGNYLIGHFKYESQPSDYIGVDFETGRWFNRNLRIFRNIQRIKTKPSDRILVIFGAGHLNILNYLFECSPEYSLEDTNKYLE